MTTTRLQPCNQADIVGTVFSQPAGYVSRSGKRMARVEIEIPPPCGGDTVVVPVVACGENVDRLTALKIGDTVRVAGRLELDSPRPPGIEPIRIHARIIWTETFAPATATTSEKATSAT